MDRTVAKCLWVTAGSAAGLMLVSNLLIRATDWAIPPGIGGVWIAGMIVDGFSLVLLTWSASRRRKHPEEALVAAPVIGWCCYVASASLWPAPLFLPVPTPELVGVELYKLLELALLTGLHFVTQFALPARLLGTMAATE